jgi:hypothetical protein
MVVGYGKWAFAGEASGRCGGWIDVVFDVLIVWA